MSAIALREGIPLLRPEKVGDEETRAALGKQLLPRDVAERIAYRNAEALFGIQVSPGLFGKR